MSLDGLSGSRRAIVAAIGAAVALYAIAAWFLFVSPKRAEAQRLETEVVAAEARLAEARAADAPATLQTRVSDLFRLAKAMPASGEQASLLLELDVLARKSNVTVSSVTLQSPTALAGGSSAIPVAVTVSGSYREVTRFLRQMRRLVGLSGGDPRAVGRLFTVQSVELTESKAHGFPRLDAAILLNAHVYDGPIVPPTPVTPTPTPAPGEDADATASAAGATP